MIELGIALLGLGTAYFVLMPLFDPRLKADRAELLGLDAAAILEERKGVIYENIRELEFEHDTGKVSEEDYAGLRRELMGEAVEVLKKMEAAPRRERFDRIIDLELERMRRDGAAHREGPGRSSGRDIEPPPGGSGVE
jgi:hypothetical protein